LCCSSGTNFGVFFDLSGWCIYSQLKLGQPPALALGAMCSTSFSWDHTALPGLIVALLKGSLLVLWVLIYLCVVPRDSCANLLVGSSGVHPLTNCYVLGGTQAGGDCWCLDHSSSGLLEQPSC